MKTQKQLQESAIRKIHKVLTESPDVMASHSNVITKLKQIIPIAKKFNHESDDEWWESPAGIKAYDELRTVLKSIFSAYSVGNEYDAEFLRSNKIQ